MNSAESIVEIRDLSIADGAGNRVVNNVTLSIARGEVHALVGESGSGKTTTALALLGYTAPGLHHLRGDVVVGGHSVMEMSGGDLEQVRGSRITYVPQEAATALNPRLRVGDTIERMRAKATDAARTVEELLAMVGLDTSQSFQSRYPHQLSGGQQQRLAVAAALAPAPEVVVFDEPTTGLDAIVQSEMLEQLERLWEEVGFAAVFISHDLNAARRVSQRLSVMLRGRLVESGDCNDLLLRPRHHYTRALLNALPTLQQGATLTGPSELRVQSEAAASCGFYSRCNSATPECASGPIPLVTVADSHVSACVHPDLVPGAHPGTSIDDPAASLEAASALAIGRLRAWYGRGRRRSPALHDITLEVRAGERIAIVGESGSGKSTLARCVAGLHTDWEGVLGLGGQEVPKSVRRRSRDQLRRAQMVSQSPASSLNPRRTVLDAVAIAGPKLLDLSKEESKERARELLARVEVAPSLHNRRPSDISGGQRQRVAIAQALLPEPQLLLCDEITSALDVSVQAGVIELLREISEERGLALLFVSHDLGVVASIAHHTLVLRGGRVVEEAPTAELFEQPKDDYTRALLSASPEAL